MRLGKMARCDRVTTCDARHVSAPCFLTTPRDKLLFPSSFIRMGNRKISDDLKHAALRLRARGHDSDKEVTKLVGFSLSTLFQTARQFRNTRTVTKAQAIRRGRPRTLLYSDCKYLLVLARHKPTLSSMNMHHAFTNTVTFLYLWQPSIQHSTVLALASKEFRNLPLKGTLSSEPTLFVE